MKPNKLEDCKKGASAWSDVQVPTEINEAEARFYWVTQIYLFCMIRYISRRKKKQQKKLNQKQKFKTNKIIKTGYLWTD